MTPQSLELKTVKEVYSAIEKLWQTNTFETPEDVANEVRDILGEWLAGFTELCHCNRPLRDCACP